MLKSHASNQTNVFRDIAARQQEGYLPIPLRCVQWSELEQLDFYIHHQGRYTLYRSKYLQDDSPGTQALLEAGVEYVYVPVSEHQTYYRIIGDHLNEIVVAPAVPSEKKAEMVYSTCIALVDDICENPPQAEDICRLRNLSGAMVKLMLRDPRAFGHLFDVANHDFYTATHMVNVAMLATGLATKLELGYETALEVGTGALLHDVGKLFIPSDLLNTTRDLTPREWKRVRRHVSLGYDYLQYFPNISAIALAAVYEHHERLDGSGYPQGLAGTDWSLAGQIVALAESFETMTSIRPYRKDTYAVTEALEQLENECGTKWDPAVFSVFRELILDDLIKPLILFKSKNFSDKGEKTENISRMTRFYLRLPMEIRRVVKHHGNFSLAPPERLVVHNISRSGIAMLSEKPMSVGQNIHITIPSHPDHALKPLLAFIVRCRDHHDSWHTIGARFAQVQSDEVIDHLRAITLVADEIPYRTD